MTEGKKYMYVRLEIFSFLPNILKNSVGLIRIREAQK